MNRRRIFQLKYFHWETKKKYATKGLKDFGSNREEREKGCVGNQRHRDANCKIKELGAKYSVTRSELCRVGNLIISFLRENSTCPYTYTFSVYSSHFAYRFLYLFYKKIYFFQSISVVIIFEKIIKNSLINEKN